jgi:hypothetical protein
MSTPNTLKTLQDVCFLSILFIVYCRKRKIKRSGCQNQNITKPPKLIVLKNPDSTMFIASHQVFWPSNSSESRC